MSAIDMYNRRKGAEQRRQSAVDARFRIADMLSRCIEAETQTEDGFDEALLKDIGMREGEEARLAHDGDEGQEEGDGGGEEREEQDAAAAKVFDAAADEAFASAAAAYSHIRCDEIEKMMMQTKTSAVVTYP
jgi:hypothetical protein